MFSHLAKISKKLIVLTLLMGVLVVPVSPLIAEEITDATSTPVVLDTVTLTTSTSDQTIATSSPINDQIQTTSTPSSSQDSLVVVQAEILAEPINENSFTTLSDGVTIPDPIVVDSVESNENNFQTLDATPIEIIDNLAISDENPFGEFINTDNLAISEEQNGETASSGTDNPWAESDENSFVTLNQPVDTVAVSNEGSFNTKARPAENLTVSAENSFVTQTATINDLAVSGEGNFITLSPIVDLLAISTEQNFSTLAILVDTLAISGENNFITLSGGTTIEPAISAEHNFTTLSLVVDTLAISAERNFTTLTVPVDTLAISGENNFITATISVDTLAVSEENSFSTLNTPADTLSIGTELTFNTLDNPIDNLAISDEESFTTLDTPVSPPGGGGGSYSSNGIVLGEQTYRCPIFLKKFIKYSQPNDRREVIKLQAFLKVFEGFKNLKITGVYDRETFEAVKIFQSRYLRDVLTPWGIDYPTGWVYITTRLAINNIYCGRETTNNLHFRKQLTYEYRQATGEELGYYIIPTTTPTTTTSIIKPNVFLAGVGELLDFIGNNFCWLLNLLLLLLIFFLLWLLWQMSRDDDNNGDGKIDELEVPLPPGAMPIAGAINPEDEEELAKLAEEDEAKLEMLDNNPWQEAILLGPEASKTKEDHPSDLETGEL